MSKRIIVTGGAIIKDEAGRIVLQRRSDYGFTKLEDIDIAFISSVQKQVFRDLLNQKSEILRG